MKWQIYYSDHMIEGETEEDWRNAPDDDVQVVVLLEPYDARHLSPWAGVWDRKLYTGSDEFNPFGWGVKYGKLISDDEYRKVWKDACS